MKSKKYRFLVFILCFFIGSCSSNLDKETSLKKDNVSFNRIPLNDIFNQELDLYYALIYSHTCMACKSTIEVLEYLNKKKEFDLYLIDYNEVIKGEETNIGVGSYSEIRYKSVPLLCKIKDHIIINEIYGFENIRNSFLILQD